MRKHLSLALALVLCLSLLTTGALAAEGTVGEVTVPRDVLNDPFGASGVLVESKHVFKNYSVSLGESNEDGVDYVVKVTADDIAWHMKGDMGGYWCPVAFLAPDGVTTVSVAAGHNMYELQERQLTARPIDISNNPIANNKNGIAHSVDANSRVDDNYISLKWGDSEAWVTYYIDTAYVNIVDPIVTMAGTGNYLYNSFEQSLAGSAYNYRLDITLRGVGESTYNGVTGNWAGFTVQAPEGAVSAETGVSVTSTDLILADPTQTELNNGGVTFYKNLGDDSDHSRVFAVRWRNENGEAIGTDIFYANYEFTLEDNSIELDYVIVYDEEGYSFPEGVDAEVVDGNHVVLTGTSLGSTQKYTLEFVTNIGRIRELVTVNNGSVVDSSIMLTDPITNLSETQRANPLTVTVTTEFDNRYENIDKVEAGKTEATVSASIPEGDIERVQAAANSVSSAYDLTSLAMQQAVPEVNDIPNLTSVALDTIKEVVPDATDVSVVVRPYLEVEATAYNETEGTFSVEITAKYDTYAVAGDEEVKLEDLNGASGELQLDEPITISIDLPGSYSSENNSVYVVHHKNNKYYYYDANVSVNDEKMHVIFTSHNGLSPFEFVIGENPSVAKIGGVGYGTLQEAIDDADDNAIITLLKNGTAVIDREVIFTISNPNGYTANITAANGFELIKNGDIYTVVEDTTPSRPGSSVGSSTYRISVVQPEGGTIETNVTRAAEGDTVRVTATPDEGYHLVYITVDDERISGTSFEMPDHAVEVSAVFERDGEEPPFTDVETGDWFYEYVQYVYENGLMDGVSDTQFNPDGNMTRAMFWAVLARIDGETVTGDTWMEDARAWAMESGVSDGTEPEANITREMLVTMLYRYAGLPETDGSGVGLFDDGETVSVWAYDAMSWALNNGVITGVSDDMLLPGNTATRAQCAAILMRYMELQAE